MKTTTWLTGLMALLFIACSQNPVIDDATMLDGDSIFDPSLYHPENFLVSAAIANPTDMQKAMPVLIAAHGYSATTYEWDEFRVYADAKSDVLVSQVLLGGHGRSYAEFKASTWEDWQEPILNEYNALKAKGYTNISLVGSSTGCPLALNLIKQGNVSFKHVFMVDPIVVSSDKMLTIIGLAGPMLGYLETTSTPEEESHWYHFRPQETLQQLMKLIDKTRKDLQAGVDIPAGTDVTVYKSIHDPSADPVSAVLLCKGLKYPDGSSINIRMLNSELHVMTRLNGREGVLPADMNNQMLIFDDIHRQLTE
jgi:carboxylesterase